MAELMLACEDLASGYDATSATANSSLDGAAK
jgi:hypothetical protein